MFSIKDNIAEFERGLSDLALRQMPFTIALTLNDTAVDARAAEERELEASLDRPTPFTKRGLYQRRATKRRQVAEIGFKPIQAGYLRYQVEGGQRSPKGRAIPLPVGQRRNKYGNMPKGAVKRLASAKNTFVAGRGKAGTKHLRPGIYRKTGKKGRKLKLMVAFEDRAQYRRRLRFQEVARQTGEAVVAMHFARRFRENMATAR